MCAPRLLKSRQTADFLPNTTRFADIPLTNVLEGFVVVKKNPNYREPVEKDKSDEKRPTHTYE